jgi:predicted dehydrogenase
MGGRTVAVVGCGRWGRQLVRNFHELGALELVCDPAPGTAALLADLAPGSRWTSRLEDALDGAFAGVVIATPAETHFELARRALLAGKDVLVEKPMALTTEHARELIELAAAGRRILMVGHVLEYHPAIQELVALVGRGELGELLYLYSHRLSLGQVRREVSSLWSFAPHDVAVILRLLGRMPIAVRAIGGSYLQPGIADVTVTHLEFSGGTQAYIHVSWLHPFREQRLIVIGAHRMACFDDLAKTLTVYDRRVEVSEGRLLPVQGDGLPVLFEPEEPLRRECLGFLRAIATREPPLTDGRSGVRVLEVLAAAQASLEGAGRRCTIEPIGAPP